MQKEQKLALKDIAADVFFNLKVMLNRKEQLICRKLLQLFANEDSCCIGNGMGSNFILLVLTLLLVRQQLFELCLPFRH